MFVIKIRQLFPESDWCNFRDRESGVVEAFEAEHDALRRVDQLRADRRYRGYEFQVDQNVLVDREAAAACDRRNFQV